MERDSSATASATLFEAVIVPHRSLSPRGLRILILGIVLLSGLFAFRFWLIGAWPVVVFSFAEVSIAILLLHLNVRRARTSELVLLSNDSLRIIRSDRTGRRQERVLPIAWMNVVLDERPGRVPKLLLAARGIQEEIGATLGEAEKCDLASALREALHQARNPRFDNVQLRD